MQYLRSILDKIFHWNCSETTDSELCSVRLNKFTLSFPKKLEVSFLEHYYNGSLLQINIAGIAGAILFSLFSFADFFLVPNLFVDFLFYRIVLTWFIIGSLLWLLNVSENKKIAQPLLSFAIIIVSSINLLFIVLAFPILNYYYYIGLILMYFWSYAFLKLRFVWASFTGFIVFFLYLTTSLFIIKLEPELFWVSSSYLLAANFGGMGIAYALEYYSRWNYIQNLRLKNSIVENESLQGKLSENSREISLAEEKLMLQSKALESAANSIIMLDRDGVIIWCNKAFTYLTGYESSEVVGKTPRLFKSGKHNDLFYKNIWTTILGGKVWQGEILNKKKSGDLYYEEMIITPVTSNGSKKVTHFIAIKQDISLRKDMENELFASERRLRGLFENATMGIYRSTSSGKMLMANTALLKMFGFESLEELRQIDLSKFGYKDPAQRKIFLNKIYQAGSLIGFESEWQKKDGTSIFIRESARIDTDENGETIFEGTVEDITASKLAEVSLKESKERLQTVFDNVYDAIFIHDSNGKIIDLNSKVLDLYNISREDALNLNIQDLFHKKLNTDVLKKYWESVVNKGKTYKFEWKALRPNDDFLFDVEIFLSKITLGEKEYVLANIRDITEQKEANRKLLITQKAVELNASPIFWLTKDSKFIYVNSAAVEKLGYSFNELINMKISDINTLWTDKFWNEFGYKMIKSDGLAQYETELISKNGTAIPVELTTSIINYENEEVIIAIVNDIAERKIAAENLIKAKEQAEQSDKLKSDFLAGMSHEIRTPVNTILNFVSLIKSDIGSKMNDDIKYSFDMIDNGARRLIRTIDSILNMSQLQSGSYELKTEPTSIVKDILKPLDEEFRIVAQQKNLDFELIDKTNNTIVLVDQYTITQLFINLIDNATKYTKTGGIKIVVSAQEDNLLVEIIDTGIGISEEFLPTLFEPFIQEEMGYTRSFEGNGLGLALVSKYLELNNGTINVKSKKGIGSTFTVTLKIPTQADLEVYNATKFLHS